MIAEKKGNWWVLVWEGLETMDEVYKEVIPGGEKGVVQKLWNNATLKDDYNCWVVKS